MFVRDRKCNICGKAMWRKRGFSFKHKVDSYCGDGCFVTYNRRVHVCNDCLAVLRDMIRDRINHPTLQINLDVHEIGRVVNKEMNVT